MLRLSVASVRYARVDPGRTRSAPMTAASSRSIAAAGLRLSLDGIVDAL
jgi:hypothetical protein